MATIARIRALDEIRRVRPVSLEDMPEGFEPAAEEVDPLGARDRSERLSALMSCLEMLDEEKRQAVLLAYYRGFSHEALAKRMQRPVPLLNQLHAEGGADLDAIETFWIARVHEFFAAKPFRIRLDASRSLRTVVRDVLEQAEERQKTTPGVHYAGSVMQHMVGAKLDCALGAHNSYSTSDQQSGRSGDFFLGDVAIHVTTSPGEAVIERCRDNLNDGFRPILVTGQRGFPVAEGLADNAGLADRIDVFEVEQFIALNLYELGKFGAEGRRVAVSDFVTRYNEIIEDVETDPSLKIEFKP